MWTVSPLWTSKAELCWAKRALHYGNVAELVGKGQRKILLNFVDVNYIDSSGLGNLVSSLVRVRMYDGELKLLNLTKRVHDVMQVTKLNTVFQIMDDEAVAVKSLRQSAGKTG